MTSPKFQITNHKPACRRPGKFEAPIFNDRKGSSFWSLSFRIWCLEFGNSPRWCLSHLPLGIPWFLSFWSLSFRILILFVIWCLEFGVSSPLHDALNASILGDSIPPDETKIRPGHAYGLLHAVPTWPKPASRGSHH